MQHAGFLNGYHSIAFSPFLARLWIERKRARAFRPLDGADDLHDVLLDFLPDLSSRKSSLVNQSFHLHNFHLLTFPFLLLGLAPIHAQLLPPAHEPERQALVLKRSVP